MAHTADMAWLANPGMDLRPSIHGGSTIAHADLGEPVERMPRIMPAVLMSIGLWAMIIFAVWEVVA